MPPPNPNPRVYIDSSGKKTFVPLENNPTVFSELARELGVSSQLGFYDIYSLTAPELLSLIPKPVHALILISPSETYHRVRETDVAMIPVYDGAGEREPIMWFKQTIGHSCGLIALLHGIANNGAREFVTSGSELDRLLTAALPLRPSQRAQLLYDSEPLERAHMGVAGKGDTVAPSAAEPNGYHFITFVRGKDGHLYELEGAVDGPIDRGALGPDENLLSAKALDMGIMKHVRAAQGNLEFSIVAMATVPDQKTST